MPRHGDFGHPYGAGWQHMPYGMPPEAFKDSSPDKSTKELEKTDLYEGWRDILVVTCVNMSLLGAAWCAKAAGYAAMYNFTCIGLAIVGVFSLLWWGLGFIKLENVEKTPHRLRYRLAFVFIGFILAFALHYWFFS